VSTIETLNQLRTLCTVCVEPGGTHNNQQLQSSDYIYMLRYVNSVVVQLTISKTVDKPGFELHAKCISILYLADMNNNSTNVSVLLGYGAVLLDDWWPTFRQSVQVLSSGVEKSLRNGSVSR